MMPTPPEETPPTVGLYWPGYTVPVYELPATAEGTLVVAIRRLVSLYAVLSPGRSIHVVDVGGHTPAVIAPRVEGVRARWPRLDPMAVVVAGLYDSEARAAAEELRVKRLPGRVRCGRVPLPVFGVLTTTQAALQRELVSSEPGLGLIQRSASAWSGGYDGLLAPLFAIGLIASQLDRILRRHP